MAAVIVTFSRGRVDRGGLPWLKAFAVRSELPLCPTLSLGCEGHPTPGEIIPQWWATSSRNGGARSSRNRWAASSRNDGRLHPESAS